MTKLKVVAVIVDTTQVTLYLEDGNKHYIPQGHPELRRIISEIQPICSAGGVAEIEINQTEAPESVYKDYQKTSGGLTKLFRVAKSMVAHIFGSSPNNHEEENKISPQVIGNLSKTIPVQDKLTTAIDDIMAHAQPVESEAFASKKTEEHETIVAVVKNEKGETRLIPGMENLKGQFDNANKLGTAIGVENFLKRLTNVIDHRGHSVEDLLNFMKRGDLPIADDGSIVAYKVLKTINSDKSVFYDCHTGRVRQKVGSFVCMDEKLVDPSRHHECSNGLHIARRGYLRSFGGDIMVLCKIAPEDVIAVPHRDPNKVRVRGYHIIFQIPAEHHVKLRNNAPMTDNPVMQKMLGAALSGQHVGMLEEVKITQQNGCGVEIKSLDNNAPKPALKNAPKAEAIHVPLTDEEKKTFKAAPVDPNSINKKIEKKKPVQKTRNEEAADYFNIMTTSKDIEHKKAAAKKLLELKKKSKVSWFKLGLTESAQIFIDDLLKEPEMEKQTSAATPATMVDVKTEDTPPTTSKPEKEMNRVEKARHYFTLATSGNKASWGDLWSLKKTAKKSWKELGFTSKEEDRIKVNKPDWV